LTLAIVGIVQWYLRALYRSSPTTVLYRPEQCPKHPLNGWNIYLASDNNQNSRFISLPFLQSTAYFPGRDCVDACTLGRISVKRFARCLSEHYRPTM